MTEENLIAPGKTVNTPFVGGGTYVGVVKQVTGKSIFVEVPSIAPGFAFGPCLVTSNAFTLTVTKATVSTPSGTTQAVTNAVLANVAPPVGSKVLCTFLNNEKSELVITGRIL